MTKEEKLRIYNREYQRMYRKKHPNSTRAYSREYQRIGKEGKPIRLSARTNAINEVLEAISNSKLSNKRAVIALIREKVPA